MPEPVLEEPFVVEPEAFAPGQLLRELLPVVASEPDELEPVVSGLLELESMLPDPIVLEPLELEPVVPDPVASCMS